VQKNSTNHQVQINQVNKKQINKVMAKETVVVEVVEVVVGSPKKTNPKKTKETGLAVPTKSLADTIQLLTEQLEALGNLSSDTFQTGSNDIEGVIIKDCKDVETLVSLVGVVELNRQAYVLGQELLGITILPEYRVSGCSMKEVLNDARRQAAILTHSVKADKIKSAIAKLKDLMTKEDKREAVMLECADLGIDIY